MFAKVKDRRKSAFKSAASVGALIGAGAMFAAWSVASFPAFAQHDKGGHEGGATSHQSGSSHDSGDDHGDKGAKKGKGRSSGEAGGGSHKSLEDIFRDVAAEEDDGEDSDRPSWAGQAGGPPDKGGKPSTAGSKRGDLFGDLWVILRDEDGVPILTPEGFVQPLDASGNPIPLDEEGAPIDPTLVVEVELGRLNVGRSPSHVLDQRAGEVIDMLTEAAAVALDPAGRLVITNPDGSISTIDSPLENLAIYVALLTTGGIPGVNDLPGDQLSYLVDHVITAEDYEAAASFLAAASDKASSLTEDDVAYISAFLGINTTKVGDVTYTDFDFDDFSYDRSDSYDGVMVTVLVAQPDGTYVPTQVDLYDAVFGGVDYTGAESLDAFAQAADDARAVIEFLHDNEVR